MNTQEFIPTTEQLRAVERHLDSKGRPFYTCRSATDPDCTYTLRWHPGYAVPSCNCKASYEARRCWHVKTVLYAETVYQEALKDGELMARMREQLATRQDGDLAYTRPPFSLLKSA